MPQTRSAVHSTTKRKRPADGKHDDVSNDVSTSFVDSPHDSAAAQLRAEAAAADAAAVATAETSEAGKDILCSQTSRSDESPPPSKKARKSLNASEDGSSSSLSSSSGNGSSKPRKSLTVSSRKRIRVHPVDEELNDEESEYLPLPISKTVPMKPPPRAGMVDPVGYKTNPPPQDRPVRVYADGVFDLFHLGHMRALEQCKTAFDNVYLIVGVTGDAETHRRKGLTVLSGAERAESVRHCKWVDEVVPDCPWIVTPEFLDQHEIDYVAHDDLPYGAAEGDDIYAPIKQQGKFLVTQRTEGVSTTGIITHIVRDYDKYISRQLQRGTTRQELNVSWLKKNELEIKRHVSELRDTIKHNWSNTQELGKELRTLWQGSRPGSPRLMAQRSRGFGKARDYFQQRLEGGMGRGGGEENGPSGNDFATGYSLGLMGGVRAWMTRNVSTSSFRNRNHSRDETDDDSDPQSPKENVQIVEKI